MGEARPLAGQKAIVTGASSGIGQAIAIALGKERAKAELFVDGGMTLYPGFESGG